MKYFWFIDGDFYGESDLPIPRAGMPISIHYGCTVCGRLWAEISPADPEVKSFHTFRHVKCPDHGSGFLMDADLLHHHPPRQILLREVFLAGQDTKYYYICSQSKGNVTEPYTLPMKENLK